MIRINGEDMKELAMFYNFSDERFRKAKFALMPLKIQVKKVEKDNVVWLTGIEKVSDLQHLLFGLDISHEMKV